MGGGGMFWRLMIGTVAMLAFGYAGESKVIDPFAGFVLGMSGWGYILFEIFAGEAGKLASSGSVNKYVQQSFKTMRFIVTVGWSIYPLGYLFGYLMGSVEACVLNLIYNLADFVNKIAFCLAIWAAAKASTLEGEALKKEFRCVSASYYRNTKNVDDKAPGGFVAKDDVILAKDEGDGWLFVQTEDGFRFLPVVVAGERLFELVENV